MKWAFVDYENVGNLNRINLNNYDKTIIFVGAKQNMINFGDDIYFKPIDITYIKITEVNKNNLDLHLAYYLSDYNQIAPKSVTFEVISNDRAFAPLIKHINLNIRNCIQVGWTNKVKTNAKPILIKGENKKTPHLINNITYMPVTARPKSLDALCNHIQTYMRVKKNVELEVQKYIQELLKEGVINIDNELVKYNR
jgi:hypothetical protein